VRPKSSDEEWSPGGTDGRPAVCLLVSGCRTGRELQRSPMPAWSFRATSDTVDAGGEAQVERQRIVSPEKQSGFPGFPVWPPGGKRNAAPEKTVRVQNVSWKRKGRLVHWRNRLRGSADGSPGGTTAPGRRGWQRKRVANDEWRVVRVRRMSRSAAGAADAPGTCSPERSYEGGFPCQACIRGRRWRWV
jgi:hypothetical protein